MAGSPRALERGGHECQDVLHAWRDFECSFFAGAACSRRGSRSGRFLARERYRVEAGAKLELTPAW